MKIIVDAMGGDRAPLEIVRGALEAAEELKVEIILVGQGESILRCLNEIGLETLPKGVEIAHAQSVISMEDDPASAVRSKRDSSMSVALTMLRDGGGDAVVSAGSTGALLSGATLLVRRIRGIRRAALAPVFPTTGRGCILIDCGANSECTAEYLQQFAIMGECYARCALGCESPRVGLLNIGAEESKGCQLQRETYQWLKASGLNFVGNVEARDIYSDVADVIVSDGFSGNILLKTMEGTALYMGAQLKGMFVKNLRTKLGGLLLKKEIGALRKKFDYSETGGTMLLGISKPVIKAHGSSGARAIKNAIRQAAEAAESGTIEAITEQLAQAKTPETQEK